jgi:hypothetical protein
MDRPIAPAEISNYRTRRCRALPTSDNNSIRAAKVTDNSRMSSSSSRQIPPGEVRFHPLSVAGHGGRVFWWNGGLYRGISAEHAAHYQSLFNRGIVKRLIEQKLLVETQITDLELQPYALILKHRVLPAVTYAPEWPSAMLQAAAELTLTLQENLLAEGLMLHDAHPFNVLFDGIHPLFVDLGSIVPANGLADSTGHWPAYDEFCRFFLNPLKVMAAGHARVARWLMHDNHQGITKATTAALCREPEPSATPKLTAIESLRQAQAELRSLKPLVAKTEWSTYWSGEGDFPDFDNQAGWNEKRRCIARLFQQLKPRTMLDIGSNRGWFSQLAARAGTAVLATDLDEQSLNLLHDDTVSNGLPIQPLLMDFGNPLPGYGINNCWLEPAMDRLKSDLVLALAVVHHMTHKQYLRFEQIVDGLAALSNRWVIVEFIAREDIHVARWPKGPDWYTLENFSAELQKRFRSIQQFPSDIDHRFILLCGK